MKAASQAIYVFVALAAITLPAGAIVSRFAPVFWFLVMPLGCIVFLDSTKTRVLFKWDLLLADLRRSLKFLTVLAIYNAVLVFVLAYLMKGSADGSGVSLSFVLSSVLEELFFRATLITVLERVEQRLFDAVDHRRVIAITSVAFGLWHVGAVLRAPTSLIRFVALHNVLFAIVAGIFLGTLFTRSRNLPSVIAVHWWVNLQNRVLQMIAFSLVA